MARSPCTRCTRHRCGARAEVASQQWAPLIDVGCIFEAPDNPLSPREVSEMVVELAARGATGASVSPDIAGWVWNSAERTLFAAGYRQD